MATLSFASVLVFPFDWEPTHGAPRYVQQWQQVCMYLSGMVYQYSEFDTEGDIIKHPRMDCKSSEQESALER